MPGGGLPVHHRHLHVHQHNVIRGLVQLVQSHLAVVRHIHHKPRIAQQLHSHDLVEFVVLHQQHACARIATGNTSGAGAAAGVREVLPPAPSSGCIRVSSNTDAFTGLMSTVSMPQSGPHA
jgi:hypothetical protein